MSIDSRKKLFRLAVSCALLPFVMAAWFLGHAKGRVDAESANVGAWMLSVPYETTMLIDQGEYDVARGRLAKVLDGGILASIKIRSHPLLNASRKRELDQRLAEVLAYRQDDGYLTIDLETLTPARMSMLSKAIAELMPYVSQESGAPKGE